MLHAVKIALGPRALVAAFLVALAAPPAQAAPRGNLQVASFEHAKAHLRVLYAEHPETLYSGCAFDAAGRIDYGHCPWRPQRDTPRAHKVEWEHVVPAQAFGKAFAAWRDGDPSCIDSHGLPFHGRRCAQRASADYRRIEADLYNLYPEIGEVNQIRSNRPMDAIAEPVATLAPIGARLGGHSFEPRPAVRGEVARTYLYMHSTYPDLGALSPRRRRVYRAWSAQDPVDAWECRRAWRIAAIQGNTNKEVRGACRRAGLWPDDDADDGAGLQPRRRAARPLAPDGIRSPPPAMGPVPSVPSPIVPAPAPVPAPRPPQIVPPGLASPP